MGLDGGSNTQKRFKATYVTTKKMAKPAAGLGHLEALREQQSEEHQALKGLLDVIFVGGLLGFRALTTLAFYG